MVGLKEKYNLASEWYDKKYVSGGYENNSYMKDEYAARKFWENNKEYGSIISLGIGSGQDIEILGHPDKSLFIGYDISDGMIANARKKFPDYTFELQDCREAFLNSCDILVSLFGTPNYIGASKLLEHYDNFEAKHAFFIFYNENYNDDFDCNCFKYDKIKLWNVFKYFNPIIEELNENYYIVKW